MNHHLQQTVVKRGGFLSAVAYGLFGMLTAGIVCGTAVGLYGLNLVDRKLDTVLDAGGSAFTALPEVLPELRKTLPPALADALNDRRDPDYRESIALDVHLGKSRRSDWQELIINVDNCGDETITLLALRVVLVDENNVPVRSLVTYPATPITVDSEWRGPILPGSLRECSLSLWRFEGDLTPHAEITDLRVWSGPADTEWSADEPPAGPQADAD